jgi:hypothetical protein
MTWFDRLQLTRIATKIVRQGPSHQGLITEFYQILAKAARREFTEDNKPTLATFLRECHEAALKDIT